MKNLKLMAVAAALVLGGCAYHPANSEYRGYQAQGEQSVRFGVVESVRDVKIGSHDSGVGTAGGAVLGGIAGSTVGGGSGQAAGAIAGAILGGLLGQSIEKSANDRPGVEVTVLLDSGQYVAVVQGVEEPFRSGERVRILSGQGTTRVTH